MHPDDRPDLNQPRRRFIRTAGLLSAASFVELTSLDLEAATYQYHVVRKSDSLSEIAEKYKTSVSTLKRLNGIRGDLIRVGQKLKVKLIVSSTSVGSSATAAHRYHTVRRGDVLSSLAKHYGMSVTDLMKLNGLRSDVIRIGQKLKVGRAGLQYVRTDLVRVRNLKSYTWKNIIAHHSGIRYGNAEVYGKAHTRRGMKNGLAYHFVIGNGVDSRDGLIEIGPRWKKQLEGGHVKSRKYNLNSIGICLVGDFQKFRPSAKQLAAFKELTSYLKNDLLRGRPKFYVHNDLEQTLCPGKYFPKRDMHKLFG